MRQGTVNNGPLFAFAAFGSSKNKNKTRCDAKMTMIFVHFSNLRQLPAIRVELLQSFRQPFALDDLRRTMTIFAIRFRSWGPSKHHWLLT